MVQPLLSDQMKHDTPLTTEVKQSLAKLTYSAISDQEHHQQNQARSCNR